ncbi:MAG: eukaryotic-like serine/threonine-protein kinase [Acidobacteriota bacterium]|jgi:tetratricopeptide (TPR) repeat protein|nr:eukaryotic-like serine/threonine-protein kinase [Acidobacteriota bacterium]
MLRSRFTRSPQKLGEEYARQGDFPRAIEAFGKAGDWRRAAEIAGKVKNEPELVRCSLMAGLGRVPEGYADADAMRTAELLASQKLHELAIPLFEVAWELRRAAECALAARDPIRAAKLYERAGDRLEAARCYRSAGKPREALQLLEEGSKTPQQEETILLRAELLRQLGRDTAATALLASIPPSLRAAELLERSGQIEQAVYYYLDLGETEKATRAAAKHSDRDRLLARIYLRSGRAIEAGHLFAQIGLTREAAEAYETGRDWGSAAYRWEAAREPRRAAEAYEKAGRLRDAARCFAAAGLPERAAELAERAVKASDRAPKPAPAAGKPGKVLEVASRHLAAGEKARAAAVLLQIGPGEPDFARAAVLLAPLLLDERFYDEALGRLRQVPPDAGGDRPLACERYHWEGRTLEAMGDFAAAQESYEVALALVPNHVESRRRLGWLREGSQPPVVPPDDDVLIRGSRIADRYEVLSLLGRGGMGRVYKAHDRELDEVVAIKTVLQPATSDEARLFREVQICRRISHPNVVRVYDLGRFPGGIFVTMEHLEGRNLELLIEEESPLPFERIRAILTGVASGLREAHSLGVIHRDLKPANIMVTATRVKILDFGIASMQDGDPRLTQAGFVMGSPMYMSPDQLQGRELDGRSDLYSLGILAYTLIGGREPFHDSDPTVLALKQLREKHPDIRGLRSETPAAWAAFLDRLLAKEPEERFQSAQEVLDALAELPPA